MRSKCLLIALAMVLVISLVGCGMSDTEVNAEPSETIEAMNEDVQATEEELDEETTEEATTAETTEEGTVTTGATTTARATTTASATPNFMARAQRYSDEFAGFTIQAPNHFGTIRAGNSWQYTGSALGVDFPGPTNTQFFSQEYSLFITQDGSITFSIQGSEGAFYFPSSAVFQTSVSGGDVTFRPGQMVRHNNIEFTVRASGIALARSISALSPMAMVAGLCMTMYDTGDISTSAPAIAITLAALAAKPSIFTVTLPGYSLSIV